MCERARIGPSESTEALELTTSLAVSLTSSPRAAAPRHGAGQEQRRGGARWRSLAGRAGCTAPDAQSLQERQKGAMPRTRGGKRTFLARARRALMKRTFGDRANVAHCTPPASLFSLFPRRLQHVGTPVGGKRKRRRKGSTEMATVQKRVMRNYTRAQRGIKRVSSKPTRECLCPPEASVGR